MSSFSSLPEEVLKLVMKHVPLMHRLGNCSLVSTKMHAAAVAATEDFELCHLSPQRQGSLLGWMYHYGQHLTKVEFSSCWSAGQPLQELPLPNLLELKLNMCDVRLGAAFGFPGVIQGCTNLTHLVLECCMMDAPARGAVLDGGLSRLVHLQYLLVVPCAWKEPPGIYRFGVQMYNIGGLSWATLPQLQHLTFLKVHGLSRDNILQLGSLTKLQSLDLMVGDDATIIGPSTSAVPGLTFPASLKTLFLLSRVEPWLLSLVPTELQELQVSSAVGGPVEGPGSLLWGMARLQHLTVIILLNHYTAWPLPGPAYSALTASSKLVQLHVGDTNFPPGIWPHVFPAGRKLPHLTSLTLCDAEKYVGNYGAHVVTPPQWDAADVSSLVSCCPNLCDVDRLPLQPGQHVSELHKLTALTRLCVKCKSADLAPVVKCLKGLADVTQLRELSFSMDCAELTGAHLLPLTTLAALTSLSCGLRTFYFYSKNGSAPDVWLQLLEHCTAAEPGCQPSALRSLAQQLAEQRGLTAQHQHAVQQLAEQRALTTHQQQQIASLQEQLSAQQQAAAEQVAGLQERLSAQQQQSACLQEQLSAQQLVAAQQGAQIAALHAQLQELLQHHK